MTITIREPRNGDFFAWLGLYEEYAAEAGAALTEEKALLLWSWLTEPGHPERGLIAVSEDEDLVGFAHFHGFPRPLQGDHGVFVDQLHFTGDDPAVGESLLHAVRDTASRAGAGVVEWTVTPREDAARGLSDRIAAQTESVTYALDTAAQPA